MLRLGIYEPYASLTVLRVWRGATYLRLENGRPIHGGCSCTYCKAHPNETPKWDTLGVPNKAGETAWKLHAPDWTVSK